MLEREAAIDGWRDEEPPRGRSGGGRDGLRFLLARRGIDSRGAFVAFGRTIR